MHHPAPVWNYVTATTNTNRNPETNPNIHPPSLSSHLIYPRPTTCLLASGCWQQCGRYKTRGVPKPTVIGHFGASSYTGWAKTWGDCVWLATPLKGINQFASLLAYFNIVLFWLNTVTEVTWLTVNKFAVRVFLIRNKSRYRSLYVATLGYIIDENNLKKLYARPSQYAPLPASWPMTFWPWKWCPIHVWRGLPPCQF